MVSGRMVKQEAGEAVKGQIVQALLKAVARSLDFYLRVLERSKEC